MKLTHVLNNFKLDSFECSNGHELDFLENHQSNEIKLCLNDKPTCLYDIAPSKLAYILTILQSNS